MKKFDQVDAKLADYGWTKRTLRIFGIGGVSSYEKYMNSMAKAGFSKEFLKEIGLSDPRIFRADCLIFTIKDVAGKPIAFAGRWLDFDAADQKLKEIRDQKGVDSAEYAKAKEKWQPKYVNTKFEKGGVLFGFHVAKVNSRSLYVFEGYADCVTAYNAGLINSVAVCGTAWNEKHLELARGAGIRHIINCFDNDAGGESGRQRFVELAESKGTPEWRFDVIEVPKADGEKKVDPDLFIRLHGIAAFRKLPKRSHFYWWVHNLLKTEDAITVAGLGVGRILKQPNPLFRWDMLDQLSQATSVPREFLFHSIVSTAEASAKKTAIEQSILDAANYMSLLRDQAGEAKQAATVPAHQPVNGVPRLAATRLSPMTARAGKAMPDRFAILHTAGDFFWYKHGLDQELRQLQVHRGHPAAYPCLVGSVWQYDPAASGSRVYQHYFYDERSFLPRPARID